MPRASRNPPAPKHKCVIVGCVRQIPMYLLMCTPHWKMVPDHVAAALQRAERGKNNRRDDYAGQQLRAAYIAAVKAAVAQVNSAIALRDSRKLAADLQQNTLDL